MSSWSEQGAGDPAVCRLRTPLQRVPRVPAVPLLSILPVLPTLAAGLCLPWTTSRSSATAPAVDAALDPAINPALEPAVGLGIDPAIAPATGTAGANGANGTTGTLPREHLHVPGIADDQLDAAAGVAAGLGELARDLPRLFTPRGLLGAVTEAAWWSAHLVTYPWGLLREEHEPSDRYHLRGLAPAQRGMLHHNIEAAGTPILLVHGIIDNHAIFTVLKNRLRRKGFHTVVTVNYSPTTNDIRQAAVVLAAEVEAIVALTGYERVHVVGHSLGGLIARYYVQRLGGDERIHTLVTLGTPHRGSLHAHALPVRIGRQLRPGSDLMTELDLPAPGCRTRCVAYWSDFDQIIVPHTSARLDHPDLGARNIAIHDVGHLAIPRQGRVAHEIAALLSQLDLQGHTLAAGVTPLHGDTIA